MENLLSSYHYTHSPHTKDNNDNNNTKLTLNNCIVPNTEQRNQYNKTFWTRKFLEIAKNDDFDFSDSPRRETLVSFPFETKYNTEEIPITVFFKNMYYLGYFFKKWICRIILFDSGAMGWFHPWFVIRHRYFYRGY